MSAPQTAPLAQEGAATKAGRLAKLLTPEQQRVKIAEACGWRLVPAIVGRYWKAPKGYRTNHSGIPDYLNDLNAMHEAIMVADLCHADFLATLWNVCGLKRERGAVFWTTDNFAQLMVVTNATAAQRAEAFLRTLGLREEPA